MGLAGLSEDNSGTTVKMLLSIVLVWSYHENVIKKYSLMKKHDNRDRLQILHLILANLNELTNYYSPWNHQKTYGFVVISGGVEVT